MTNAFDEYIPIPRGQTAMVMSQRMIADLMGQTGYEVKSVENKSCAVFTRDLTAQSPAIKTVTIELIVMDFSKFDEYDLIPIDANMEGLVVDAVWRMFAGVPPKPGASDSTSDTK